MNLRSESNTKVINVTIDFTAALISFNQDEESNSLRWYLRDWFLRKLSLARESHIYPFPPNPLDIRGFLLRHLVLRVLQKYS